MSAYTLVDAVKRITCIGEAESVKRGRSQRKEAEGSHLKVGGVILKREESF